MLSLEDVYADIKADPFWDYLRLPGINFVPGRGQPTRPVAMVVGEAPGATENKLLKPFCGPSGTVLDHLMAAAGLRADDNQDYTAAVTGEQVANVWITNVVKYRPPHNATPNLAAIWHAKDDLRAEYRALGNPPVIICVGGVAHNAIHPEASVLSVSYARSAMYKPRHPETGETMEKGPWIISQLHPAYGLRKGPKVQDIMTGDWADMGRMMREMGIL
jgi:uracil-DNA glycosylase family 4